MTSVPIPFQRELNLVRYEKSVLSSLLDVAMRLVSEGKDVLGSERAFSRASCVVILSAPWYVQGTRTLTLKKDRPVPITKHLLDQLEKEEEKRFLEALRGNDVTGLYGESIPIDRVLMHVALNGYGTLEPIGKSARECMLTYFFSETAQAFAQKITETLMQMLPNERPTFMSSAFTNYHASLALWPQLRDFLIVNVTGEMTEVSLVGKGLLRATASFPVGAHALVRILQKKLSMSLEEAYTTLTLLAAGTLTERTEAHQKALDEVLGRWTVAYSQACHDVSQGTPLPQTVILITSHMWQSWFAARCKDANIQYLTLRPTLSSPILLDEQRAAGLVHFSEGVQADVRVAIGASSLARYKR